LKTPKQKTSGLKCNNCGADLILIETTTTTIFNNLSPITKTIYHCSNTTCQEETNKRTAKRIELIEQRELMQENRKKASQELKDASLLNQASK
jgi:hypothetical protein